MDVPELGGVEGGELGRGVDCQCCAGAGGDSLLVGGTRCERGGGVDCVCGRGGGGVCTRGGGGGGVVFECATLGPLEPTLEGTRGGESCFGGVFPPEPPGPIPTLPSLLPLGLVFLFPAPAVGLLTYLCSFGS